MSRSLLPRFVARFPFSKLVGFSLLALLGLVACTEPMGKPEPVARPTPKTWPLPDTRPHTPGPPTQPFLRLDPGMHTAPIIRIDTDAAGRFAVSASLDKTVRVWSLATNQLLAVLRPPLGAGDEGKLYAVAMSPDGEWVATGGWTEYEWNRKHTIYIFHRRSGQLRQRLSGLPNVIHHLAFSVDGRYLAAALGSGNGIRVYERPLSPARRAREASNADLPGFRPLDLPKGEAADAYGDDSYWVEFSPDGRLLSSCLDGYLRLYDPQFRLRHQVQAPGGEQPFAARFRPDGKRIAVGFADSPRVAVLDGDTLAFEFYANTQGVDHGNLLFVAWSADGQRLWAGGAYREGSSHPIIFRWSQAGGGSRRAWAASTNTLMDVRALPDGGLLFGASDPLLGRFDAQGAKSVLGASPVADYRHLFLGDFLLSKHGETLQFAYEQGGKSPARFDLETMNLTTFPENAARQPARRATREVLLPPDTESLAITGWEDTYHPKYKQQPLPLETHEFSRCLAIAPDRQSFLLGTEWLLRYFTAQGQPLGHKPVPGIARGVNISGDGDKAVVAFGDGTLRWYRLADGAELLALYPHPDRQRWVLWTPEGFFAHSPGAESLIGYHLNQGADREGEFIGVDQVYELFYRPDLVLAKFRGEADRIQTALGEIGDIREVLKNGLPPVLALPDGEQVAIDQRDYRFHLRIAQRGGGLGKIEIRVNGKVLPTTTARPVPAGLPVPGQPYRDDNWFDYTRPLTLREKHNRIEARVFNQNGVASQPVVQTVTLSDAWLEKPDLYVLSVGVSDYRDAALRLDFADEDARAVQALFAEEQRLFRQVHVTGLVNAQATKRNIQQAIAAIAAQARPQDVFIWYLAGHGTAKQGAYYFIPQEATYTNRDALLAKGLSHDFLQQGLTEVSARKTVLILDACESGQLAAAQEPSMKKRKTRGNKGDLAIKTALDRLIRATGSVVLASASEKQVALEGHQGHGVFTFALLNGLRGQADVNGDSQVSTTELSGYLNQAVPALTKRLWGYEQIPMHSQQGQPFPLRMVR